MAPVLEQSAYNCVAKYQARTATATFSSKTKAGNLIVVVCICAGALPVGLKGPVGFTRIGEGGLRDLEMAVWYMENAPPTSQLTVGFDPLTPRSIQVRALEYSGIAQSGALDKVVVRQSENSGPFSGSTGNTTRPDSLALAFIGSQYGSTVQYGFIGNLSRLFENTSPQSWSGGTNQDWERCRLTIHQNIASIIVSFALQCILSTVRRWICILICFKGQSAGPVKITAKDPDNPFTFTSSKQKADLTCFGPLQSKNEEIEDAVKTGTVWARISPSNYQYRLGGWGGLLIGSTTQYHVEGTEGLYGYQVRSSDDELPRGDGSLRGIDLESEREILFKMNVGRGRQDVELNMDTLMRQLVPQREEDWELIWRHPTQPVKMMRVRPIDTLRDRDKSKLFYAGQNFALKAVDPRHYAAIPTSVKIPVSQGLGDPLITKVSNIGSVPAYPIITINGPTTSTPVTRIQLVNATSLVIFEAALILQRGSVLVADMEAYNTGAPRSIVTLDGQSKYGSWQLPREPFRIDPDPKGFGAYNEIYLRTEPAGALVSCTIQFRDTWAG